MNAVRRTSVRTSLGIVGLLLAATLWAGCNTRHDLPTTTWYGKQIKSVTVDPADAKEKKLVAEMFASESHYQLAAATLESFYMNLGDVLRTRWAQREGENLRQACTVVWEGELVEAEGESTPPATADAKEAELVENLIVARTKYLADVDALATYYEDKEDEFKAWVVHSVQARFHPEETYMYLLSAALPSESLSPTDILPEANDLFERGQKLYNQGTNPMSGLDYEQMRRAFRIFKTLVQRYPTSTRIAQAAYYVGDLYGRFFQEPYLGSLWIERALMWDPAIPQPARFRLACLYDYHLADQKKAFQLYHESLQKETAFAEAVEKSGKRIGELKYMVR
jgi:hypothetical protein